MKKEHLHIHYLMPQGIGDVIMTIPVLKEIIRSNSVRLSITVKSKTEAKVISELCPGMKIEYIYIEDIIHKSGLSISTIILVFKLWKLSPDIILTQFNVSSFKSSLVSFFSGIKKRVGWEGTFSFLNTLTLSPTGDHKIAENLKSLKVLNLYSPEMTIEYPQYKSTSNVSINGLIDEILISEDIKIALSPGSQELDKHKRWPKLHFSTLINEIKAKYENASIFLVGSPLERELCEDIMNGLNRNDGVINIAGKTTIKELLYLLNCVHLTITNCNGISHLACVANSPIIGLYGPTNYKITGPVSSSFVPISQNLDCSPCFTRDYQTGCGNPICMENISVKTVFDEVQSVLAKIRKEHRKKKDG